MVWAASLLKPYQEESHFSIKTYQQALRWILDLKKTTGRLARRRLRLLKFHFKIVCRLRKYHEITEAMSRLPHKVADTTQENADGNDYIPAYCMIGRMGELNSVPGTYEDDVGPLHAWKTLMEAQANNVLSPNFRWVQKRVGVRSVNEVKLLFKIEPIDMAIPIHVSVCYRKTLLHHKNFPTLAGNPGTKNCLMSSKETYYWYRVASSVHELALRSKFCRLQRPSQKHQR